MITPKRILVTGKMKSGKTYYTIKQIEKFAGKRKLIVWCSYNHPDYLALLNTISIDDLPDFLMDKRRLGPLLCVCNGEEFVKTIAEYLDQTGTKAGMVFFDDSSNIYSGKVSDTFANMIHKSRNLNYFVYFQTHSLGGTPPFLFKFINEIIKFQTDDFFDTEMRKRVVSPTTWRNLIDAEKYLAKKHLKEHKYFPVQTGNE